MNPLVLLSAHSPHPLLGLEEVHHGRAHDPCCLCDLGVLRDVDLHPVEALAELVHHLGEHRLERASGPTGGGGVEHAHHARRLVVQLAQSILQGQGREGGSKAAEVV